jgi:hypothetical protein
MTITLTPDIEQMLTQEAEKTGMTPEALALAKLRAPAPIDYRATLPPPRDDWERQLRSIAVDCGVSLTDEQVSRDSLYDDHL